MRFDLRNNTSITVTEASFPALVEDVSSNCLYYLRNNSGKKQITSISSIPGEVCSSIDYDILTKERKHYTSI